VKLSHNNQHPNSIQNVKKKIQNIIKRSNLWNRILKRKKRQFNFSLGADHEEGVGTDLNLESRVSIWKSKTGNTKLDGSATYSKHFGTYGKNGRGRLSAILNFSHNY
jgi:Attacin, C-terminal region